MCVCVCLTISFLSLSFLSFYYLIKGILLVKFFYFYFISDHTNISLCLHSFICFLISHSVLVRVTLSLSHSHTHIHVHTVSLSINITLTISFSSFCLLTSMLSMQYSCSKKFMMPATTSMSMNQHVR